MKNAEETYMAVQQKYSAKFGAYTLPEPWQIEAMEEYAARKNWVSVNDALPVELPLERLKVIVYGDWNDNSIAHYQDKTFYATDANDDSGDPIDITRLVTHWMYMPKEPESL